MRTSLTSCRAVHAEEMTANRLDASGAEGRWFKCSQADAGESLLPQGFSAHDLVCRTVSWQRALGSSGWGGIPLAK